LPELKFAPAYSLWDVRAYILRQEALMRRFVVYAAALCVALGSMVVAQQKVSTPQELDTIMKKAGAFREVDKAIQASNAPDAKAQLAIVRQAVLDSQSFWTVHRKGDAVILNKKSLEKLDDLEKVLSAESFSVAAATAAYRDAGASCRACHSQYRTEDADNQYILKPGSVQSITK
jgi:cytochrome c556